jgi:hypothetical protein
MSTQHSIFEPSTLPPDPDTYQFRCTNVAFVAACLCANLFDYHSVERGAGSDVVFILNDPRKLAAEYLRRFASGIFPAVNPKLYNDARAFLMNEVSRIRAVKRG